MARAKSTRTENSSRNKNVTTMPENTSVTHAETIAPAEAKKLSTPVPINVEAEIRRRAYELYQERGCTSGHENEDWLTAEQEVRARYNQQKSA